jgi:DNA-binding NtrC family response regulator
MTPEGDRRHEAEEVTMSGPDVLLVDDEVEFVELLAERLGARGLRVETANSGPAAVARAEEKTFDAIILDLAMPGMNGIETLQRLRATNPDLQIILLTGHATIDTSVTAMKLGAVDILEKPADLATLVKKIDEASTRKRELARQRLDAQLSDILRKRGW